MEKIGRRAAEIILRALGGETRSEKCYVEETFIIRESFVSHRKQEVES